MTELSCINEWLGVVEYDEGLLIQQRRHEAAQSNNKNFILGLEHQSVITLGKRGDQAVDVASHSRLPIYKIDRGGQATLHSPGQLVIYPIINIEKFGYSVRQFVEILQDATIQTLKAFQIDAFVASQPGVYTKNGKIGFLGIRVENGITRHGVSLNVCNELDLFSQIRSCGVGNSILDSMQMHGVSNTPEQVFEVWSREFKKHLT